MGGCSVGLEDGYKPRALGASPDIRKSYYASPFTDQAEAGKRGLGGAGVDPGMRVGH